MNQFRLLTKLIYIGIAIHTVSLKAQIPVVGGYNVPLRHGLNLVGLQVDTSENTVSNLFRDMPEGTTVYKIVQGAFTTNAYRAGQWDRPDESIAVGEGIFVLNPTPTVAVANFFGVILQGDSTNSIPAGLSIRCSISPSAGKLTQDLGLKLSAFDNVYLLSNGALQVFTYIPDGAWKPSEPNLQLGGAILINAASPTNWVTHYEVNP